jgi:hypothetical protein
LRGEHEIYAVLLDEGGSFIFLGPGMDIAGDREVVIGQGVDAETVLTL